MRLARKRRLNGAIIMYGVNGQSVKPFESSNYELRDFPISGPGHRSKSGGNTDTKQHSPFDDNGSVAAAEASQGNGSSALQEVVSLLSKLVETVSSLFSSLEGSRSAGSSDSGKGANSSENSKDSVADTSEIPRKASRKTEEGSTSAARAVGAEATSSGRARNVIKEPIIVDGGVFDGMGAVYTASSKLGDGGQGESQKPVFILKNGATLKNVTIGENGADGIHVYGGATLDNVNWQDVGEDALTVKSAGNVNIIGGSASNASDKIFQINADTTFYLKDFKASGFQTLIRTNGGKPITANVTIDGGQFANGTTLFRTDSQTSNVQFAGEMDVQNVKVKKRYLDQKTAF